jgi:hypothetical protein
LVVDELPTVVAVDTNKSKSAAQVVSPPMVILGRIDAESSHFYRLQTAPGQRLTIEVLARRLGSPLDPLLHIYDAKTQRELIHLSADDTPGLQGDCRLVHTFSQAGEYLIEVRDSTWRGGADFHYRLRIADCPGVTTAYPLVVQRGQTASISFTGPGGENVPPVKISAPADVGQETLWVSPRYRVGAVGGWPVPVLLDEAPQFSENEPNDTATQAQQLPVPSGVSARFEKNGDLDYFRIHAKKGQKLAAVARTFEFLSPADVFVRILNAKGNELARSNPSQAVARAEWTVPEDGDYWIVCEHLNYRAGPNEVYHLAVQAHNGDFTLSCGIDRVALAPGGRTALVVGVNRLDGWNGPIELQVLGGGVVQGATTVPAGQNFAILPVDIRPGTPLGVYPFRVQGRARIGEQMIIRHGFFLNLFQAGWGNMSHPPLDLAGVCVAAAVRLPYTVAVQTEPATLPQGQNGKLIFTATWEKEALADIAVAPVFLPPNITTTPPTLPKGKTQAVAELKVAANAAVGAHHLLFHSSTKIGGKEYVVLTPASLQVIEPAKGGHKQAPQPVPKKQ